MRVRKFTDACIGHRCTYLDISIGKDRFGEPKMVYEQCTKPPVVTLATHAKGESESLRPALCREHAIKLYNDLGDILYESEHEKIPKIVDPRKSVNPDRGYHQ